MNEINSGTSKIDIEKDDSLAGLSACHIAVLASASKGPVTVSKKASEVCDIPMSALWDTAVNFDDGDAVTIWGPNFNFTFASDHNGPTRPGVTLCATAAGSLNASVTFAGHANAAPNEGARATLSLESSNGDISSYFDGMSEPHSPYKIAAKAARRVIIPYGITLTPRVLLGALLKMPSADIEDTIENLIAELNTRDGDSDDEPEPEERIG